MTAYEQLAPYFEKKERLRHLMSLISFDVETTAPEEAIERENDLLNFYYAEYAGINQDPEFIRLVKAAKEEGGLNDAQALLIDDLLEQIEFMEKLPMEKFVEWNRDSSKCMEVWKKAKNANDWAMVLPYFKKLVANKKEEAKLLAKPYHKTTYDAFLDQYEKGQTEADVDAVFGPLKEFLEMDEEGFYHLINQVSRSLIRTESDEYTYCLHIIIRYELERDLINGKIEVEDLPEAWKKKYKEYLGVDVPDFTQGILQDVHWFGGSFGYFPSYALGNLYGAQILHYMNQDIDVAKACQAGNLTPILDWLREKDFAYDYLNPKDWIIKVTGEPMNPKYFTDYLAKKFF